MRFSSLPTCRTNDWECIEAGSESIFDYVKHFTSENPQYFQTQTVLFSDAKTAMRSASQNRKSFNRKTRKDPSNRVGGSATCSAGFWTPVHHKSPTTITSHWKYTTAISSRQTWAVILETSSPSYFCRCRSVSTEKLLESTFLCSTIATIIEHTDTGAQT